MVAFLIPLEQVEILERCLGLEGERRGTQVCGPVGLGRPGGPLARVCAAELAGAPSVHADDGALGAGAVSGRASGRRRESPYCTSPSWSRKRREVHKAEWLLGEFLSVISHELRAPLASVKGCTATVLSSRREPDRVEVRQFFRFIDKQVECIGDLIGDLLDTRRIEAVTLAVEARVSAVADLARSLFLSGGGTNPLRIDRPPDLPPVSADPGRIVQVIGSNPLTSRRDGRSERLWRRVASTIQGENFRRHSGAGRTPRRQ